MNRYVVYLITTASFPVTVEADGVLEAMDKAEMEGAPGLCHQCSAIDLADWEAKREDVEVIDE